MHQEFKIQLENVYCRKAKKKKNNGFQILPSVTDETKKISFYLCFILYLQLHTTSLHLSQNIHTYKTISFLNPIVCTFYRKCFNTLEKSWRSHTHSQLLLFSLHKIKFFNNNLKKTQTNQNLSKVYRTSNRPFHVSNYCFWYKQIFKAWQDILCSDYIHTEALIKHSYKCRISKRHCVFRKLIWWSGACIWIDNKVPPMVQHKP